MDYVQARLLVGLLFVVALIVGVQTLHAPQPPSPIVAGSASDVATELTSPSTVEHASTPDPINDAEAAALMSTFVTYVPGANQRAIERILAAHDRRFIPVFIELLHGIGLGLVHYLSASNIVPPLEALSGRALGGNWRAWMEWYGTTDLAPPPGFTGWKGRLLGRIDAGFAQFLQEDVPARIRSEEIVWGGVRVDGIPALDQPPMLAAPEASYLEPGDAVFGLVVNGEARAYPLRIMDWHEMANDLVGGVPVSLSYCTLCGSAIAFSGRASDGTTYTFGSSGLLFRSNKLMYDRQTRTLWNQLTGEPVLGPLANSGVTLRLLPVVLTRWERWRAQHPDTLVLDINTGFERNYTTGAAYGDYFASPETMFPVGKRSAALDPKTQIYALRVEDVPKAYPLERLVTQRVVNDTVGEKNVVLVTTGDLLELAGQSVRAGAVSYSAGAEVRTYERGSETFRVGPDEHSLFDEVGRLWSLSEGALVGPTGQSYPRLSGHLAYWFGWFAFFPHTSVYGQ